MKCSGKVAEVAGTCLRLLDVLHEHKRIDGGISGPRTPSIPRRPPARGFGRPNRALFWPPCPPDSRAGKPGSPTRRSLLQRAPRRSPSVRPVVGATRFLGRKACRVERGNRCRHVHRGQDLLGDVLRLDEGDPAERGVALRARDLKPGGSMELLGARDVFRLPGRLVLLGGCWRGLCVTCSPIAS
jgi:hypothetical protein